MIQRVQSLYLFLAGICGVLSFVMPFAKYFDGEEAVAEYSMFGVFNLQSDIVEMAGPFVFPAWVFGLACSLTPLIALALYKNRSKQHQVARLSLLLFISFVVYLLFGVADVRERLFSEEIGILHHVAFYLLVAGTALCFLAIRGIKKDDELVKSLDRIR
jgi:hypothetical protein